MQADEYGKMATAESSHWWYRATHCAILDEMSFQTAPQWLDACAGTGGFLQYVESRMGWRGHGFDIEPLAVKRCKEKGLQVDRGDLNDPQTWPSGPWDCITATDSFYFVRGTPAKQAILGAMWNRLNPGGRVILQLPALAAFSGTHDLRVGIDERATRALAYEWIQTQPWIVRRCHYRLFFLSPLIALSRGLSRWRWRVAQSRGETLPAESDVDTVHPLLNTLFFAITRLEDRIGLPWPWGSSLVLVLEKPRSTS